MYITVLCKVVDNLGDIGVAWRMCRRLAKIQSKYKICLVVDNLVSFNRICDDVDVEAAFQNVQGVDVYNWNNAEICHEQFVQNDGERLSVILECFQCGRPDWMEKILFEEKLERTVQIIMIDYLTAEKYAEDFHCLKSLTRSAKVQKVNFMPGFTGATGGLIIDDEWKELPSYNEAGPVLVFTYTMGTGLLEAPWSLRSLPYMNQSDWDKMMKQCSALIIRGEESMSRAALSGIPFIWQAYPQSEEYHLVKVKALLERMKPHFEEEAFEIVEKAWLYINTQQTMSFSGDLVSLSGLTRQSHHERDSRVKPENDDILCFLNSLQPLRPGFVSFSQSLRKNGDLCTNLMTFIDKIAII